jgi:hypothetical protein
LGFQDFVLKPPPPPLPPSDAELSPAYTYACPCNSQNYIYNYFKYIIYKNIYSYFIYSLQPFSYAFFHKLTAPTWLPVKTELQLFPAANPTQSDQR